MTAAITFKRVLLLASLLRVALIIYGEYHDRHSDLKYTDIDYRVFSDATTLLLNPTSAVHGTLATGSLATFLPFKLGDPYARDTYRYTPLLALLLVPNELLHPLWGKILFAACDIAIGVLLYRILRHGSSSSSSSRNIKISTSSATLWIGALWLLNPMVANISTRGSAESVLGLMVISSLGCLIQGYEVAAAVTFGLAVHFKIYPAIYGTSVLAWLAVGQREKGWYGWGTWRQVKFGALSFATFFALGLTMYGFWGQPFLEHTYLYHIARRDHRHNFSLYFYPTYLSYPATGIKASSSILASPLISFVPQMGLAFGSGVLLVRGGSADLAFAWFVQTMAFVNFNKVCTSQYFMWSMWFLPLVLPRLCMPKTRAVGTLAVWILAQALWLSFAYRLEFLGEQVFLPLWLTSAVFLISNSFVLVQLIDGYSYE